MEENVAQSVEVGDRLLQVDQLTANMDAIAIVMIEMIRQTNVHTCRQNRRAKSRSEIEVNK
jgi:predicted HAD superfamily phosphohydrolase YqeG